MVTRSGWSLFLILALAAPAMAGVTDPHEIIEESQLDPSLLKAEPTPQPQAAKSLTDKVTNQVQSWWNQGVKMLSGEKPKAAAKVVTQPKASPAVTAEKSVEPTPLAPSPFPVTASSQREVKAADLRAERERLKSEGAAKITTPGRKGTSNLKLSSSGVPLFPIEVKQTVKLKNGKTKVVMAPLKKIPKLDIGEEPKISSTDFTLKNLALPLEEVVDMPALSSPDLTSDSVVKTVTSKVITPAMPALDMDKKTFGLDQVVSHDTIKKALPKVASEKAIVEKPYRELSEPQLKMLTAMILLNKGDRCPVLLGLFDELSRNDNYKTEANYHLGQCAFRMKMTTLGFERLGQVVASEHKVYAPLAIQALSKDLPADFEVAFAKLIRGLKNPALVPADLLAEVNYLTAKGSYKEEQFQTAKAYAEKVPAGHARYMNAQYLVGISQFALGQVVKAGKTLEVLREKIAAAKNYDKNLNSLTAINLARIKFSTGKFKEALPLYMAIDKDHPLWVQGLIEQGWTQLALDDFSGAIGNMYSLHSPYFKAVYKPESFVVRTIGYLNICQYGDAYRTLSWLEHEARPWVDKISQYTKKSQLASDYYQTVTTYLKGKSDSEVDGLPPQVVREMARQREYLNYQSSINDRADEAVRYESIEKQILTEKESLKARTQKATQRFNQAKANIKKAETDKNLLAQVDQWRQQMKLERELVIGFRYQTQMLENSRKQYEGLKQRTLATIDKQRYQLREAAGKSLVATLNKIKGELSLVIENNEFLRYETFAGSGENIRYQVAGGQTADANRIPSSVKPTKLLNWSFDGEYWEDEIGSYRSSLKNNCPQIGKMDEFFKDKEKEEQAALEKGVGQ